MKRGLDYYLRSDYSAAKQMFEAVNSSDVQTMGVAAYYKGAIAAYYGDELAYKYFADAIKNAPKEIKEQAVLQLAKYAFANANWDKIISISNANKELLKGDNALSVYFADALFRTGKKEESKAVLSEMLSRDFSKKDSLNADIFTEAFLNKEDFTKQISENSLDSSTVAAKARLDIISGRKISYPQSQISLYAQIVMAEDGDDFDANLLEKSVQEQGISQFSWRASLVIARKNFVDKNYESAMKYAKKAQFLAPPDMSISWRVYMLQGDILRLQKKYDESCHAYLKVAMDKDARGEPQAESLYKVGVCYYEQGEWIKAHTYFQRVFVGYFKFEYWGALAYYYDARALYTMKMRREANITLSEYFRRAKIKDSQTFKEAKNFYDNN